MLLYRNGCVCIRKADSLKRGGRCLDLQFSDISMQNEIFQICDTFAYIFFCSYTKQPITRLLIQNVLYFGASYLTSLLTELGIQKRQKCVLVRILMNAQSLTCHFFQLRNGHHLSIETCRDVHREPKVSCPTRFSFTSSFIGHSEVHGSACFSLNYKYFKSG